jgi:hypothetical protein
MSKLLIRVIPVLIVLGLFFIILFRNSSPFGKRNSSFGSEPKEEITRIEFSQKGKKLILQKEGEYWLINGKTQARKSGILFIIKILTEIKIKSPVSHDLYESEITKENIDPVRVKVYENRRLLKTLYVYKTNSNIYGNIMKLRGSAKPFIVYVPGYEGDIGSAFTLNELFWQPYTVFNLLPSEITSVKLENIADTASSFKIIRREHHFFLSGAAGNLTGWDSSLVFRYISYFAFIPFESWSFETGETEKKKIESKQPLYRLTVNTTRGSKSVLTLWEKEISNNGTTTIDSDRLLGKTDTNDELFILRYFDIDPIIKKRSYFFPK